MKNKVLPVAKQEYERDELERSASQIKAEFQLPPAPKPAKAQVAPATTLRQRILSISLFPNPYNRQMMLKYGTD